MNLFSEYPIFQPILSKNKNKDPKFFKIYYIDGEIRKIKNKRDLSFKDFCKKINGKSGKRYIIKSNTLLKEINNEEDFKELKKQKIEKNYIRISVATEDELKKLQEKK